MTIDYEPSWIRGKDLTSDRENIFESGWEGNCLAINKEHPVVWGNRIRCARYNGCATAALMMTPFASVSDWGMISSDMVFVGNAYVLSSITTDEKPPEIVWPEMVAWPPGAMVESEMTRPPLEALVMDLLSMRINLLVGYVGRA